MLKKNVLIYCQQKSLLLKLPREATVKSLSMGYFRFNQLEDNQNLLEVHRFSLSRRLQVGGTMGDNGICSIVGHRLRRANI